MVLTIAYTMGSAQNHWKLIMNVNDNGGTVGSSKDSMTEIAVIICILSKFRNYYKKAPIYWGFFFMSKFKLVYLKHCRKGENFS